jgi:hypothetical protein
MSSNKTQIATDARLTSSNPLDASRTKYHLMCPMSPQYH